MKSRIFRCAALVLAAGGLALTAAGQPTGDKSGVRKGNAPGATKEQFERWMKELSNWGRWGKDDQLGTANLYTQVKRKQALALAATGTSVSLAHDVIDDKGSDPNNPFRIRMIISPDPPLVRDRLDLDYHGGFFTHLDAICHVVYQDRIFNGLDFRQTITEDGCARMAITNLKDGIVTRAVLIDVPRLRGVPYLEPGTRVYREDIEDWERKVGVKVGSGDALLIRTGRWARRAKVGATPGAGMDASFLPLLKDRDVALFGSDTAHELMPDNIPGLSLTVIHKFAVVARGMNLLDNLDLEAVAETAERLKRWEFALTVNPLRIPKGTGSPINPIAIF